MSKQQEINAIYDRLCWIIKGVFSSDVDPETCWEVISLEQLAEFVQTVNDCWHLEDAGCRLMNSCYINEWYDFGEVAKIIYDGGGRINKHMDTKRSK